MEVRWDNWPHTSLLWKLGSYCNQIETSVTLCLKSYGFIFGMELPWENRQLWKLSETLITPLS